MVAWVCVHNMSKFICYHHAHEHLRRHFCSCFAFQSVDLLNFLCFSNRLVSLLWDTLTGREHLLFYGRLKNLKGAALSEVCKYNHQLHFNICLNETKIKEWLGWFSYRYLFS